MYRVELVWPSCCIMLHYCTWSCKMLNEVWFPSNIWWNIVQHFFCSCGNNKVALIWPRTSTLLPSHMRYKSSLRQGYHVVWPKFRDHYSSQISNLYNSSLHRNNMLHSFGHAVQHRSTKLNSTMLNDVAFVWPELDLYLKLSKPLKGLRFISESYYCAGDYRKFRAVISPKMTLFSLITCSG